MNRLILVVSCICLFGCNFSNQKEKSDLEVEVLELQKKQLQLQNFLLEQEIEKSGWKIEKRQNGDIVEFYKEVSLGELRERRKNSLPELNDGERFTSEAESFLNEEKASAEAAKNTPSDSTGGTGKIVLKEGEVLDDD